MNLRELKKHIEEQTLGNDLLILKHSEDNGKFIIKQYINEIAKIKKLDIVYVDTIQSMFDSIIGENNAFFDNESNSLYVCDLWEMKFEIFPYNPKVFKNCVIIVDKINKECENLLEDYITIFPKLERWQIIEYIKSICKGLTINKIEWLSTIAKDDINRLYNEFYKISLFKTQEQDDIFDILVSDNAFSDLSSLTIFDFTNAIMRKDINGIKSILESFKCIDIEPIGVITILLKQFKNVINIQLNPKATAESIGMTPKQFNAIKYYNCKTFNAYQLINIYQTLTKIDYLLKSGQLHNDLIVDYIIVVIFGTF